MNIKNFAKSNIIYLVPMILMGIMALACGSTTSKKLLDEDGGMTSDVGGDNNADGGGTNNDMVNNNSTPDADIPEDITEDTAPDTTADDATPDAPDPTDTTPDVDPDTPEGEPCTTDDEGEGDVPAALASGGSLSGALCPGETDVYTVTAEAGCRVTVDVAIEGDQAALAVHRSNDEVALEEAPGVTSQRFTFPTGGEGVRFRVSATATETLPYTISAAEVCPATPLSCEGDLDDLFEDNDDNSDGQNPAVVSAGDTLEASMCAAGPDPFERFDYYTIEDERRYQGCIIASRLNWPVTAQTGESVANRGYYRDQESLDLQHSLGDVFGDGGPNQGVLRTTWRLGDVDQDVASSLEVPQWLVIPELEPSRYLDPVNDFEPDLTEWNLERATAFLYPVDYHVRVSNESYSQDGTAVVPSYTLAVEALCDFSCAPREGDAAFGILAGDDWFDAYEGLGGGLNVDLALDQGGRLGGFARGVACERSPYNGFIDTITDTFETYPKDIDVVTAGAFGKGYVDGQLQNNAGCTAALRVEWPADQAPPRVAWTTTFDNTEEQVWTYDAEVSTVNDAENPFFAHSSPAAAFSGKGWMEPPTAFAHDSGPGYVELHATSDLFNSPSATVLVQVAIAHNPANGSDGTAWSARYYCLEDGLPE